jgi:hypothetical protein
VSDITFYKTVNNLGGNISANILEEAQGALFPNVSAADASAGITHYACLCVKNTGPNVIANAGVYFASDFESSSSYVALGLTGKNSTTEQTIASQTTAPTGAFIFQQPSADYAAMRLGPLNPGEFTHIWLKRVVQAFAGGSSEDYFILTGVIS